MRSFVFVCSSLVVIGLAVWAYHENYRTQAALSQAETLQEELGTARARLAMLRAEWAYLNRPDRLRALADAKFDALGLLPLSADQFGHADQIVFPAPEVPALVITNVVEVSGEVRP